MGRMRSSRPRRRATAAAGVAAIVAAALASGCAAAPGGDGRPPTRAAASAASVATPTPTPDPTAPARLTSTSSATPSTSRAARPAATPLVRYVTRVPLPKGCLLVSPEIVGIKVYLVQRALHLVGHKERYDGATVAAVRSFQSTHHLAVTGAVDATTWTAFTTGLK